jgi:L-aminopeptidase/D-esterase-like protein
MPHVASLTQTFGAPGSPWRRPNGNYVDPFFEATVGAREEAIINAIMAAKTLIGQAGKNVATAIMDMTQPSLLDVMKEYNRLAH